jgi:Zn finger protein HypA/HybF involved in hydrogenase expression
MHEYGMVRDLLAQVDQIVRVQAGRQAVRVVLGVTGATGPEEHLLRDAFDAFKVGTSAGQAELVLERAPFEVCCLDCGAVAMPAQGRCSLCGSGTVLPASGQDIYLKSVEIEV